jgi:cytochrome b561
MNSFTAISFSRPLIILHWAIAAIVLTLVAGVELHEIFPKENFLRSLFMQTHFWLGLSVGMLTLVRIAIRFNQTPAPITPAPALWQLRLAAAVHWAFYGILLVMPVLGYLLINAKGFDLSLCGLSLGHWVAKDEALSETLEEIHKALGNIFIALVVLHTLAALYHHYILKDSTFSRMRPSL